MLPLLTTSGSRWGRHSPRPVIAGGTLGALPLPTCKQQHANNSLASADAAGGSPGLTAICNAARFVFPPPPISQAAVEHSSLKPHLEPSAGRGSWPPQLLCHTYSFSGCDNKQMCFQVFPTQRWDHGLRFLGLPTQPTDLAAGMEQTPIILQKLQGIQKNFIKLLLINV